MLRSVALPIFAVTAVLMGAIQCGPNFAVQETPGPPGPTPKISQQQMDATRALLNDALLDPGDIPGGLAERAIGREDVRPSDWTNFLNHGGWLAISTAWTGGTEDIVTVQEAIYAFENLDGATGYAPAIVQGMSIAPDATAIPGLPTAATGYERTSTDGSDRVIEIVSSVDRLLVWTQIEMSAARADWQDVATALHLVAEQRAQEALTAAGD